MSVDMAFFCFNIDSYYSRFATLKLKKRQEAAVNSVILIGNLIFYFII